MEMNTNARELHQLEDELHTEILPGTEIMTDVGSTHFVKGKSSTVLVPQPSSDPHDPLNWPVSFLSQLVNLGAAIWRARATSYNSFMGACVLNGIAAGPAETMQPAVIADIFFLHDRGKWNTLYFVVYFGSLMVGPIISGPMSENVGWRNFWWLYVAMIAVSLIMITFMQPETLYHRHHPGDSSGSDPSSDSDEKKGAESGVKELGLTPVETAERDPHLGKGTPSKAQFGLIKKNPNWIKAMALDFWIPWKLFAFPIVEFASFIVSWSASCFLTLNLTEAQVFAAPPYGWKPANVGFTNFAVLVGGIIGLVTSGPLSDYIAMRLTRKNRGVREPEMRLPTMIPYVLVMILGNFCAAYGYQDHWTWPAVVVLAYGCAGLQVAALPAIASTYAVDSYKPVAGSLFVSITVNKNLWGYGFSKFITPWTEKSGYVKPIMLNMCLTTLWCLFGIVMYYYGKTFRRWTKNDKVHLM
ncbi:MAG: hypothetical protein Q9162_000510 [Coniocarpon cinnabarinum]